MSSDGPIPPSDSPEKSLQLTIQYASGPAGWDKRGMGSIDPGYKNPDAQSYSGPNRHTVGSQGAAKSTITEDLHFSIDD